MLRVVKPAVPDEVRFAAEELARLMREHGLIDRAVVHGIGTKDAHVFEKLCERTAQLQGKCFVR
jgi:hypothetical protein